MSYRVQLRIACVLCILHAVMHQIGMLQPPGNPEELALSHSMQALQVNLMGSVRSVMDIYTGMGSFLTVMLVGFGVLLWQFSSAHGHVRAAFRPALLTIALTFVVFAAASVMYFFIAPILMEALVAALVLGAWFKARHGA